MKFKYYVKDVYGNPLRYPADAESQEMLHAVAGDKTATDLHIHRMEFFGVEIEEVLRPKEPKK